MKAYFAFDEMCWPSHVAAKARIEDITHGTPAELDARRSFLAAVSRAYAQLILLPRRDRDRVVAALRAAAAKDTRKT
ncbi:MAG: hypothetical protein HQ581_22365 [Planctomycetes bacterium]|nr:hypothetical protein [Planctomycetota bacterium]